MTSGSLAVLLRNMDYDATDIASTYDRGRDHGPEFLDLWMDGRGLVTREISADRNDVGPSYAAYAKKLAAGAGSVLASLSRPDFDLGMRALRAHAAQNEGQAVFEPIDVFVFR